MAPVKKPPAEEKPETDWMKDLHYKDYLAEVMKELEADPEFKKHVENSKNRTDIAMGLEMTHHRVRNQLDEIKRREIERLNKVEKAIDIVAKNGEKADLTFLSKYDREHLDHSNPHSFEVADLQKLIDKIHKDLNLIDQKENEDYKRYEMEKEHERQEKLRHAKDVQEKERLQKEYEESQKRHNEHPKVHHPGSEEQLKEVWETEDHMDKKDYNPKAIFKLHDLNGDGRWDEAEIEAIMQHELDKVYQENNTDDDINERYHEMMRMRQEMMEEADTNKDSVIDAAEFDKWTNAAGYKRDEEWKTVEETGKKPYTNEEFENFERQVAPPEPTPATTPAHNPAESSKISEGDKPVEPQLSAVDPQKTDTKSHL